MRPEASPCDLNYNTVCFGIFLVERQKLTFPAWCDSVKDLLNAIGGCTFNCFENAC